jgi:hypothetical protein
VLFVSAWCAHVRTLRQASLSQEEIDEMVRMAEEMAEEDKAAKEKIEARNKLENYVYSVRNVVKDEKKSEKLSEEDKQVRASERGRVLTRLFLGGDRQRQLGDRVDRRQRRR